MAHEHDYKDVFSLSRIGKAEENVPASTHEGNLMMHARVNQKLAKYDIPKERERSGMAMPREHKHKKYEPVVKKDCYHYSMAKHSASEPLKMNKTTDRDQLIQFEHQRHEFSKCLGDKLEDIKDQTPVNDAISLFSLEPPSEPSSNFLKN